MKRALLLAAALLASAGAHALGGGSDWRTHDPDASVNILTAGTINNSGTGITFTLDDGKITVSADSNMPNQTSLWTSVSAKNFDVALTTSGLGMNHLFLWLGGNYNWGAHFHTPSTVVGAVGLALGAHGPNGYGIIADLSGSTDSYVVRGWNSGTTYAGDMIRLDAETTWQTSIYPSLTPAFDGTMTGNFMRFFDRNVQVFKVDSIGAVYAYDPAGSGYVKMYNNGNAGIIETSADPLLLWPDGGVYQVISDGLTGLFQMTVGDTGDTVVTTSGGDFFWSGNQNTVAVATQTIAAGNTITADSCGGTKRISSAGSVTTSTTDTFTAFAAGFQCEMKVCNVGANNIILDRNGKTFLAAAGDLTLGANTCAEFTFDGVLWRQTAAALTAT